MAPADHVMISEPPRDRPPSASSGAQVPATLPVYTGQSYYGIAPLRTSHYDWRTAGAFFCTGIAGAAQIIAAVADLRGNDANRRLVRAGRYLAVAGSAAGTGLLISALHNRRRWLNMLRIFKPSSTMSIGIWTLTPFGILSGMGAAAQLLESFGYTRTGRTLGRLFGLPAAALGSLVITYMGTEQEETNMPLWAGAFPFMAPFYAAAGFANAAAFLSLAFPQNGSGDRLAMEIDRLATVTGAAELLAARMLQNRWKNRPEADAFNTSPYAPALQIGVVGLGMIVPLALRGLKKTPLRNGAAGDRWAAVFKLTGGLLAQLILLYSGAESGRRARDYFEYAGDRSALPVPAQQGPAPIRAPHPAVHPAPENGRRPRLGSLFGWGLAVAGAALLVSNVLSEKRE